MNELKVFESPEFGTVRTVEIDGTPWMVGKDVAEALGYKDTVNALKTHVDQEDKTGWQITTQFGEKKTTIINESGLYSLVLSSKLPTAKKFKRWVTSEVLPSIRKTGGYIAGQEQLTDDELLAKAVLVAQKTIEAREARIAELTAQNTALIAENAQQAQTIADFEPVRQYVDVILESIGTITTTQIAADYGLSAKALNRILHEAGVQFKVNGQWILYREHMGKGYTDSKTFSITRRNGVKDAAMHTYWTQKGRLMIHDILKAHGIAALMDRKEAQA